MGDFNQWLCYFSAAIAVGTAVAILAALTNVRR